MYSSLSSRLSSMVIGSLAVAGAALAGGVSPSSACADGTLASYITATNSPNTGCGLGDVVYTNFFYTELIEGNPVTPASSINVTVAGGLELDFTGFQNPTTGLETYYIGFDVDPAPVLTGDTISLDPPTGSVSFNLYLCQPDTPFFIGQSGVPGDNNFYCGNAPTFAGSSGKSTISIGNPLAQTTPAKPTATFLLGAPLGEFGVLLELNMNASGSPASVDAITNTPLEQGPATPEPATWMLIASGIGVIRLIRRR